MNEDRDCDQWFYFHVTYDPVVFLIDFVQGFRHFIRRERSKQGFHMAVRIGRADIILRDWDGVETLVYDIQHVTVSRYLLLIPVPWF